MNDSLAGTKDNFWTLAIVSSTFVASLFFLLPFELYYPQRLLWDEVTSLPLAFSCMGVVILMVEITLLFFVYKVTPNIGRRISFTLFLVGIFVLLADVFAPIQSTPLDGFELVSREPRYLTGIEVGIFGSLLFLSFWNGGLTMKRSAKTISLCLWILSITYLVVILFTPESSPSNKTKTVPRTDLKNIYHIVLDELQTDSALSVINDLNLAPKLAGFTIFPFNSSSYLFTKSSFPNYMSGTTYRGDETFQSWLEGFKEKGILKGVAEKGYMVSMYAPWTTWNNRYAAEYKTLDRVMRDSLPSLLPGMGDFFPIWFARILPNFLTNEAFRLGSGIERKLSRIFNFVERYPRTIGEGKEPFSSVLMLNESIAREKFLPPTGRYTYLHAVLPHGPYVMDGRCSFTKRFSQIRVSSYYQQSVCGLLLVTGFIKELKRLKRFEDSIIIVHADTGHGLRGFIHIEGKKILSSEERGDTPTQKPGTKRYPDWNERQLLSRTWSFLMIKPPGSGEPLKISEKRSKLYDLYPTLMHLIDLPVPEGTAKGVSLWDTEDLTRSRENNYYLYDPRDQTPKILKYSWDEKKSVEHLSGVLSRSSIFKASH